jgi:hypothetical protein
MCRVNILLFLLSLFVWTCALLCFFFYKLCYFIVFATFLYVWFKFHAVVYLYMQR